MLIIDIIGLAAVEALPTIWARRPTPNRSGLSNRVQPSSRLRRFPAATFSCMG